MEEARRGLDCPSYEPLLDMTLPQLANIARGGKPEPAPELEGEESPADFRRALMLRHGLDPDAPVTSLAEFEEAPHADG